MENFGFQKPNSISKPNTRHCIDVFSSFSSFPFFFFFFLFTSSIYETEILQTLKCRELE